MTDRELVIGGTYRHWKTGRLYKVLGEVQTENNYKDEMNLNLALFGSVLGCATLPKGCIAVIYQGHDGYKYAREKTGFLELVERQHRFTLVE